MTVLIEPAPVSSRPANRFLRSFRSNPVMGEVRVQVRLTNAVDGSLAADGRMNEDDVRSVEADAMIDTGAICTTIPQSVADQLGLPVVGQRVATFADGSTRTVPVVAPLHVELCDRDTFEEALVLGDEVLIGQTVLEKTDLLVDCANRRVVPNPEHPDYPVVKVK